MNKKLTYMTLLNLIFILATSCGQPQQTRLKTSKIDDGLLEKNKQTDPAQNETYKNLQPVTDLSQSNGQVKAKNGSNKPSSSYSYELKNLKYDQAGTDLTNLTEKSHYTPMYALAWDKHNKHTPSWTKTIYETIKNETPEMLGQNIADDIETFCPKYRSLNENQRLNFWGQFIVALAKFESSWDPTTSVVETMMKGNDPVTKKHIASEGLLQLSYQDEKNYRIDCGFDYEQDKHLKYNDPRKTILDPHLNLRCGIRILATQLKNRRSIVLKENVYWAPLREGSKRIPQIAAITKKLIFCN